MRFLRRQRIHTRPESLLTRGEKPLLAEQIRKGETGDAAAETTEQLASRVDQLLEMPALRTVAMVVDSYQYRYTKLVQIEQRVAEINQARLPDERHGLLALESIGLPRQRERKGALDLLVDVVASVFPDTIGKDARLRQHHAVVHQDQRLRRNRRPVSPVCRD
jgi:hypothetical protein